MNAYLAGEGSRAEIAERFGIGTASLGRWVRLFRNEGTVRPKPSGGGPTPKVQERHQRVLVELVENQPDITAQELADELEERTGLYIDRSTVGRTLVKLGYTRKKRRWHQRRS